MLWLIFFCSLLCSKINAQTNNNTTDSSDTAKQKQLLFYQKQTDLIDVGMRLFHKDPAQRLKEFGKIDTKLKLSLGPIIEYTLSTGFTGGIAASGAFSTSRDTATKISSLLFAAKYTQKKQFLVPIQTSVWLPGNKLCFNGDWRFLKYPQDTYGFGGYTTKSDVSTVSYNYIRFYETALEKSFNKLYMQD